MSKLTFRVRLIELIFLHHLLYIVSIYRSIWYEIDYPKVPFYLYVIDGRPTCYFFVYALLNDDKIVKQSMNLNHIKRRKKHLKIHKIKHWQCKMMYSTPLYLSVYICITKKLLVHKHVLYADRHRVCISYFCHVGWCHLPTQKQMHKIHWHITESWIFRMRMRLFLEGKNRFREMI